MATIIRSTYRALPLSVRRLIWVSLALHILAAWFSVGFYHPDEHYQVLEFASYKAGLSPASDLPWEFAAKCRPALQPFMAWCAMIALESSGPVWISFVLRLFAALLGWASLMYFSMVAMKCVQKEQLKKWVIVIAALLWFMPFIHGRFSAESLGGSFFFLALALQLNTDKKNSFLPLLVCGIGYGLAYVFRLQMVIMLGGLFLWMLFERKWNFKHYLPLIIGFLLPSLLNFLLSKWLYGHYVFADWNYIKVNIIDGKAAQFGTMPVWGYFELFWKNGGVLNIILLTLLIIAWIRLPRNPLTWTGIAFLMAHSFIGHKELRFLWPYVNAVPVMLVMGSVVLYDFYIKNVKLVYAILIGVGLANVAALFEVSFFPARQEVVLLDYMATRPHTKPMPLVTVGDSIYFLQDTNILQLNYYHTDKYIIYPVMNLEQAKEIFHTLDSGYFIYHSGEKLSPKQLAQFPYLHLNYQYYPFWIDKLDFNGWVERTKLYDVYTFNRAKK